MAEIASPETLEALDFPALVEVLAGQSQTPMGRQRLQALVPSADRAALEERHLLVKECRARCVEHGAVVLSPAEPLDEPLQRAVIAGTVLDAAELLAVLRTARVAGSVREALAEWREEGPRLSAIAADVPDLAPLVGQIEAVLDDEGEVRDGASSELASLRRRRRRLRSKVVDALEQLVRSEGAADALQEKLVTRRSGRYVVPVRADKRSALRGVVHDSSSSGQTLYVEPLEVLEQQNSLATVERSEEREVQRLLAELTGHVRAATEALRAAQEAIAELDALQGLARFAELTGAVAPSFLDAGLRLRAARHPLMIDELVDGLREQPGDSDSGQPEGGGMWQPGGGDSERPRGGDFVPLDLELQPGQEVVVITGPNTGGKTVALKTLGLLTLMAQSGVPVPAGEARLRCCARIHADIGDEQSIVANLSTFSAHLTRIRSFLEDSPAGSLVLLDELGTGTDPAEGAALGIALLERFDALGALTLVSTHHDALKAFAHSYPAAVNAAMEFDSISLQPTFRLALGLPGRSNAFEIAAHLGLEEPLIGRARELMEKETTELDSLLRSVEDEAQALASDRLGIEEQQQRLADSRQRYREVREALGELQERLEKEGRVAIRKAVEQFRAAGDELLEELSNEIGETARSRAAADRRARWAARIATVEGEAKRALGDEVGDIARSSELLPDLPADLAAPDLAAPDLPDDATPVATVDPAKDADRILRRGEAVVVMPLELRGKVGRDWDPAVDDPGSVQVDVRGKRLIVSRDKVYRLSR